MEENNTDIQLRQADMELKKGENMVEHEAEIFARPARTWFQSEKEKQAARSESGGFRTPLCDQSEGAISNKADP